ncbi:DUF4258 domain-containing protein [Clostridium disporicum]|uniref:DUF4258 domain-containing protein n=1 Tax=Clostridium disporicum TaxID=84024 RepID=UPI0034A23276
MENKEKAFIISSEKNNDINDKTKKFRKHFSSMTREEIIYLLALKDRLVNRGVIFGKHALSRMDERYIKERDVLNALKNGQILEYQKNNKEEILVVRGCYINRRKNQIYVVLSLTHNKIVTTYANKHSLAYQEKSNLEKYSNDIKIEIPEYYKQRIKLLYI